MLPIEHPEEFTQRVLSFVDGLDQSPREPEPHP
jgi:hypothetical protein